MFKRLTCKHYSTNLIEKGEWVPTFRTTNGIGDEDERLLVFKCNDCNKYIEKKQVKSFGDIMNFKEIN